MTKLPVISEVLSREIEGWQDKAPDWLLKREVKDFLWEVELNDAELEELKTWAKENPWLRGKHRTCDSCVMNRKCSLAWDSYNTHGDCLLEK